MFFNLNPTTKMPQRAKNNSQEGPKYATEASNVAALKTKKHKAVLPNPKLIAYIVGPKKVFEQDPSRNKGPFTFKCSKNVF